MKYTYKLYLWQNGKKGEDLTKFLTFPIFPDENLDESLNSGLVALEMPTTYKRLHPKTKLKLERYLAYEGVENLNKTWDYIVDHDDVEAHIGLNHNTRRIHLIEPSAVAQGMHCDNIALTYRLQDVDMNYRTIVSDGTTVGALGKVDTPSGYNVAVRQTDQVRNFHQGPLEFWFRNSYRYEWDTVSLNQINGIQHTRDARQTYSVSFAIPRLNCMGANADGTWRRLFGMNTRTVVREHYCRGAQRLSTRIVADVTSGDNSMQVASDDVHEITLVNFSPITGANFRAELRNVNDYSDGGAPFWRNQNGTMSRVPMFEENFSTHPIVAVGNQGFQQSIAFDTRQLSESQLDDDYWYDYDIECLPSIAHQSGMLEFFEKHMVFSTQGLGGLGSTRLFFSATTTRQSTVPTNNSFVRANFIVRNTATGAFGGAFLRSAAPYNCYDLFRKAMLSIDTRLLDNPQTVTNLAYGLDPHLDANYQDQGIRYPIVVYPDWITRMRSTTMFETVFEQKNLWEILLQIGHYMHAIPKLEFYDNPESPQDKFVLSFRQLGQTRKKEDTSRKINVFSSNNLSEFFTQYDSYVANFFSPQNVVEEWVVVKADGGLVSNNTAEIRTTHPILEIEDFEVTYDGGNGGVAGTQTIKYNLFEKSVYDILTDDNPQRVIPAKGNSLYFTLGGNRIQGLSHVPPQVNQGTFFMALQEIIRREFGAGGTTINPQNIQLNRLMFRVRYRTQSSIRINQVRPDLMSFMKNSEHESYPHHEQFFGQQDKIVDSERFSANMFGRLVRMANDVYERQEYADNPYEEKEVGDLIEIDGEPYYVTKVENELYPDGIFQKVTYSKNFNQLANIVTIPSEPRFYEVSERSQTQREVRLFDFFSLTTSPPSSSTTPRFLHESNWRTFIQWLIFNRGALQALPNFAYTRFMADRLRQHVGSFGQVLPYYAMFPSSEIERTDENNVRPRQASDFSENIVPLLHYPVRGGIAFKWAMEDNFKAGDFRDNALPQPQGAEAFAYRSIQPLRYCDIMGRADLMAFRLFTNKAFNRDEAETLPRAYLTDETNAPIASLVPSASDSIALTPINKVVGLDKDNREAISFNYQIKMLHNASDGGDDFVTFANLFGEKDGELQVCLLNQHASLFDQNISMYTGAILADSDPDVGTASYIIDHEQGALRIAISAPSVDLSQVQSIVFYQQNRDFGRWAYIVRNVGKIPNNRKLDPWWIYPTFNE